MSDKKHIVIVGGGTVSHVRNHLALCAPAYGATAKKIYSLCREMIPDMHPTLHLTKMAGGDKLETNDDVAGLIRQAVSNPSTRVIFMTVAMCDYNGEIRVPVPVRGGKYGVRLKTETGNQSMVLVPAEKVLSSIRKERKDIFLVGFKTTCEADAQTQYLAGLDLCKRASCNLVFSNDVVYRRNMVITPEESRYHETEDRDEALCGLVGMTYLRTQLNFTRSTVVAGDRISWWSELVPSALREVVNFCISSSAYKPFNGVTAGHFACKLKDDMFLSSIRKSDFNDISKVGMVMVKTDGPDTVIAYGAKPSVGGQSQRIVFNDHPDLDCIVHFHCPILPDSKVPVVSQREFECGSHDCGRNTSKGLKQFGNVHAVYLDNHGPNIVFNKSTNPIEVINFIKANFDLAKKTGGYVSVTPVHTRIHTGVLDGAV